MSTYSTTTPKMPVYAPAAAHISSRVEFSAWLSWLCAGRPTAGSWHLQAIAETYEAVERAKA